MDRTQDLLTTAVLLERVRAGDREAREYLFATYLPILQRWGRGRLPALARDMVETQDLVQITLLRALNRISDFVPRHEGAFLAYLRTILVNAINEEIRRSSRRGFPESMVDEPESPGNDAEAGAVTLLELERYERGLTTLETDGREAIILRLEFGMTWSEIATAMRKPSANAARMLTTRALARLTEAME